VGYVGYVGYVGDVGDVGYPVGERHPCRPQSNFSTVTDRFARHAAGGFASAGIAAVVPQHPDSSLAQDARTAPGSLPACGFRWIDEPTQTPGMHGRRLAAS
jgi:hypothetical protein